MATKPKVPDRSGEDKVTIREAAKEMGMTEAYVRTLIRTQKLDSHLEPIAFESSVSRHMIYRQDIDNFLTSTPRKTKRTDGRNKYVFYATPSELSSVDAALRAAKLDVMADIIHTANFIKPGREA